tara:strand:+ start:118 stop:567 length:450 start_codon:yes stop_codon:yes gene_type:complete
MDQKSTISDDSSFVEPEYTDIRTCWQKVKKGLQAIIQETPTLTFIPEDVYSECVNERAFLFTSSRGFLILTTEVDTLTKDRTLLIWIAYTYQQGNKNWDDHVNWFNKVAIENECKYIEARSRVPEMQEYAVANGWELDTIVYRRCVNEQ